MKLALVGDIGGTNARFALWRDDQLHSIGAMPVADYASLEDAIEHYLQGLDLPVGSLGSVCLACAGPVGGDEFHFTNNHWRISQRAFCARLQIDTLLLVNDFTAMALGMTRLADNERQTICAGQSDSQRPFLVIGPGTGLGVGTLLAQGPGSWSALPGEGGHVDLPVGNPREAAIWAYLRARQDHVSAEHILSGGGLMLLYKTCCALDGVPEAFDSPAAITEAALQGDKVAAAVLEQFCCFFGRVVGNNILTLGARGGVYIAGGVIPRFVEFFKASGFMRSLCDKGHMSDYFQGIPIWLVTAEYPGLMGAGVALQQHLQRHS